MPVVKMVLQASLDDREQREKQAVQATQVEMESQATRGMMETPAEMDPQGAWYSYC